LKAALVVTPEALEMRADARAHVRQADRNLEGTYLVRLFAAFEAALRSAIVRKRRTLVRSLKKRYAASF
jgi:hypothetical protein